jgi:hypothetical protein
MSDPAPAGPSTLAPDHVPVPGDLRLAWRIPILLLIVEKCWGRKASWTQMHVLSWALLSRTDPADIDRMLHGNARLGQRLAAVDPAVNLAVDLALGERLLALSGQRVGLTDRGRIVLAEIDQYGAFTAERAILDALPGKIRQKDAARALEVGL